MSDTFEDLAERLRSEIERGRRFVLSGHVDIDGDSLGSMLAMRAFLARRGKDVTAFCFEPVHDRYGFLQPHRSVEIFDRERHAPLVRSADVFMMFDFSSVKRMPGLWDVVCEGKALKVVIDHHPTKTLPGDLNIHVPEAPATGKIVFDLFRRWGEEVDAYMAEALFVAISTDTGWFRYSNVSPVVFRDASELAAKGVDAHRVYREIYQRNDVNLVRLMGRVAGCVRDEVDGRLLWATIPQSLVRELGVGPFETDELLDFLRTARTAELVVLLRELPDGQVRVNLRSRGAIDVGELAQSIGGGGHRHAAGATVPGPLDEAVRRVVGLARASVEEAFLVTQRGEPADSNAP